MLSLFPIVLILISITIAITIAEGKFVKKKNSGNTVINGLKALIYLAMSGFFIYAFYIRFYKWSDCFNESGRCYDPMSQQVYTEAGLFWIVPALIFFAFGNEAISLYYKGLSLTTAYSRAQGPCAS